MFASFLLLILAVIVGFILLRATTRLTLAEQLAYATPVGLAVTTSLIFFLALLLPKQDWATLSGALLLSLAIIGLAHRDHWLQTLRLDWHKLMKTLSHASDSGPKHSPWYQRPITIWLITVLPWLVYALITVPRLLYLRDGNLIAGWINVWGDWAVHLRSSTFFASQTDLSLESPLFAGNQFHYPYLSAYLSAILQRLGSPLAESLTWPTFALFASLPLALFALGRRLAGSYKAGMLFSYIFLLAGGWGVYYLLRDLLQGRYFWQYDAYSPLVYTDMFRQNGLSTNDGIWFMNFIMSEFFPQRAFLMGIGLALIVIHLAWTELIISPRPRASALIVAGLLWGLLPLIHTHSFIALGIIIPSLWLFRAGPRPLKPLLTLLIPAILVGFSLLFRFVFDATSTGSFIHPIKWWVPNQEQAAQPFTYWWRNAGPIIVLAYLAIWRLADHRFRPLFFAGLIIFIIGNAISFQPWHYDNLKLLTYWYLLWSIVIAAWLSRLKFSRAWPLIIGAIICLTGAGLADSLSITVSSRTGLQLASQEGLAFAARVRAITKEYDLLAAATNHDHPVSLASGRRLYQGYEGWLWTYGIESGPRLADLESIYKADEAGRKRAKEIGLDYLVFSPTEAARFKTDGGLIRQHYRRILQFGEYELFKIN